MCCLALKHNGVKKIRMSMDKIATLIAKQTEMLRKIQLNESTIVVLRREIINNNKNTHLFCMS